MTAAFWRLLSTPWGRPVDLLLQGVLAGTIATGRLWPGESRWLTELANRARAFIEFRRGCARSPRARRSLWRRGRGSRGTAEEKYRELWAREGLGYARADRWLRAGDGGYLSGGDLQGPGALPLYTGLGLCVASRFLTARGASPADVIDRFAATVEGQVPAGYRPAALENLGFAVRMLRPRRLADYDRLLAGRGPELSELFWHGAGRGLYFAPNQIVRVSRRAPAVWPALEQGLAAVRHEPGRRSLVAGLAWALTLVNVGDPEVVEWRLRALTRRPEAMSGAAHGVASALMFWRATTGDRKLLKRFLDHPGSDRGGAFWSRVVTGPARAAVTEVFPKLERDGRWGELFHVGFGSGAAHGVGATRGRIGSSSEHVD